MIKLFSEHGTDIVAIIVAAMGFLKVIVRLTPTLKDDNVFGKLDSLFNAIVPNYTKDGKSPK